MPNGKQPAVIEMRNCNGMGAAFATYGGTLQRLTVADRVGKFEDIVLGYDSIDQYSADSAYFGALIGRFANRIAGGQFLLDGKRHVLACNSGENHLHGGATGFNKVTWSVDGYSDGPEPTLRIRYLSANGEEGFPGNLEVKVTYALTANDELRIDYRARTDQPTPVNLTSHAYFNLAGQGSGDILQHDLEIAASCFTPVNARLVPTGEIRAVANTAMDFRQAKPIGQNIFDDEEQLIIAGGYDHCFVLDKCDRSMGLAARVCDPKSGRLMQVYTTEPGLQLYSANFQDAIYGKAGVRYNPRAGFCLETQHFPDSPNRASFPSTILRPGDVLESTTIYRFSTI